MNGQTHKRHVDGHSSLAVDGRKTHHRFVGRCAQRPLLPWGKGGLSLEGSTPPKPHPQDCCLLSFLFSSAHFVCFLVWECAKSLGYVRLFCDPMDCSPLGSSVHGIFQARILEWVARPSSGLRDLPTFLISSTLAGKFFATRATWEAQSTHTYSQSETKTIPLNFKIL